MAKLETTNLELSVFETHPTDKNQYRCLICKEHAANNAWMQKGSWRNHFSNSKTHIRAVGLHSTTQLGEKQRADEEDEEDRYLSFGTMPSALSDGEQPSITGTSPTSAGESEIWRQLCTGEYKFEMDDPDIERKQKLKEFQRQLDAFNIMAGIEGTPDGVDPEDLRYEGEPSAEEDILAGVIQSIDVNESEVLTRVYQENGLRIASDTEWYPYPSKLLLLLDAIDNMPRIRISAGLMKIFLWLLREVGVAGVPKMSAFRKMQSHLRETRGVPTLHRISPKGNAYSFNDPVDIIVKDWSKPTVRQHIRRYPVLPRNGVVSEIWHGEKWRKTMDRHALSPMYDDQRAHKHYYIDEPAQMLDGSVVIPIRWLEDEGGEVWFDAWKVTVGDNGRATIMDGNGNEILLQARELGANLLDLQDQGLLPHWSETTIEAGHPSRMPNPDREIAQGEPLYVSFIDIFGDDVSGNRSKSWNKHWNIYMKHRNLPRQVLQQDSHTHFVSSSPNAPVPEQFQGIKEIIEHTHTNPARAFDCQTGQQIRLKLQCNCEPGDNPAQSEVSGHIGSSGNYPCRKCLVGGSKEEKASDVGFRKLFEPGIPRTVVDTVTKVKEQIGIACTGVAAHVTQRQKETGVKDSYTQSWIESLIGWSRERQARGEPSHRVEADLRRAIEGHGNEVLNPFLTLKYSDVTQDTPVEILHTILLGVVKYAWHGTHTDWKDPQKALFRSRLQATEVKGLSIPAIRASYIMQYANSLIGRQFKILVQTNVFHVYDIVDDGVYTFIKATGVLAALLWVPEISDMAQYLEDLGVAIANVLDAAASVDPSKIVAKIKYHLLTHTPDDVRRLGPIVGGSTESYESFNIIFRHCSILSNHIAPSRDIAHQLAEQETLKHIISGGWWREPGPDGLESWRQSSLTLRRYVDESEMLQRLFHLPNLGGGLGSRVGETVLKPMPRKARDARPDPRPSYSLPETEARSAILGSGVPRSGQQWLQCKSVIANSGDECRVGSWVFVRSPVLAPGADQSPVFAGRIIEILRDADGLDTLTVVERFQVSEVLHPRFEMPVLYKPFGESTTFAVTAQGILFDFNAQHDCYTSKCAATGERATRQEREDSGKVEKVIEHDWKVERFVINSHAFHNAHRLRSIPGLRELLKPKLLYPNREQHHLAAAVRLRSAKASVPGTEPGPDDGAEEPSRKRSRGGMSEPGSSATRNPTNTQHGGPSTSHTPLNWEPIVVANH